MAKDEREMAKGAEEEKIWVKISSFFSAQKRNLVEEGALWKFPELDHKDLGKLGPGLGLGIGCGVGVGAGIFGGAGIGVGLPGLKLGIGAGAGCGIGFGIGYGMGNGVAFDGKAKYSNVGKLFKSKLPSADAICDLIDEAGSNAKRLVMATSREMEKWSSVDNNQLKK